MQQKKTILFVTRLLTGLFFGLLIAIIGVRVTRAQVLFEGLGPEDGHISISTNLVGVGPATDNTTTTLTIIDNDASSTYSQSIKVGGPQLEFDASSGHYTLKAEPLLGYEVTYGGEEEDDEDCDRSGLIEVVEGGAVFCTITQSFVGFPDPPPTPTTGNLRINEVIINDNGDTKTVADFPFDVVIGASSSTYDGAASTTIADVQGGTTFRVEVTVPDSYSKTLEGCSGTIVAGEESVCTITLDDQELVLSNISTEVLGSTSVRLNWTTSHSATSRVVYDTVSHSATGTLPLYGYALGTTEDSTLTLEHHVTITDLTPDTTYFLRAVSHGSPEVTSAEVSATTGSAAVGGGNNFSVGPGTSGGVAAAPAPVVIPPSAPEPPQAVLGIKIEDPIAVPAPVAPQAVLGFKTLPVAGGGDASAMRFVAGLLMVYGSVLVVKARMSA